MDEATKRIAGALEIAFKYGQVGGEQCKAWVIDHMVRALTGEQYEEWLYAYKYGDPEGTYEWNEGVAP